MPRTLAAFKTLSMCVMYLCVCVVIPFILDVGLVDVPTRVTQEEGHTGFLIHLPSAVLAFIFLARRIQPFLSLVDRGVEFLCTNDLFVVREFFFSVRVTAPRFELTFQRQQVSRLPTEPPGRPVMYECMYGHTYCGVMLRTGTRTSTKKDHRV